MPENDNIPLSEDELTFWARAASWETDNANFKRIIRRLVKDVTRLRAENETHKRNIGVLIEANDEFRKSLAKANELCAECVSAANTMEVERNNACSVTAQLRKENDRLKDVAK